MKILLLAGSGEARTLGTELIALGHDVTASLAGVTRQAIKYTVNTRTGGFGGDAGFGAYLTKHKPDLVIDATHPFAAKVSKRSHRICAEMDVPYLQLMRPEWEQQQGDKWFLINEPKDARAHISARATVFLATGRQTLEEFDNLADCHLICRQIDPPEGPFPFPNGQFLIGRPPFTIEDEIRLFRDLQVDVLVVKNAGGAASKSKLDAARALGLPVIMIKRPPCLDTEIVATVDDALAWVSNFADH